jgi:c-di-GMP-binding flagellar brake protein YcgR
MSVQSEKLKGFIRRLMGLSEKRRHMRAQMLITGTLFNHDKSVSRSFVTKNLSVGGALITTAASLEPSADISLKLHYSEIDIPEIKARIATSRGKVNDREYAYGLEFTDVNENLEELLKNMLYLGQ